MEQLLSSLSEFGIVGIVCGVLFYDVFYLQKKVISTIENNTRAMTEIAEAVKRCPTNKD